MSIKKNSFKIFSFSCFLLISSCSSNVANIEGTSNFSTIQADSNIHEFHTVEYGDSLWSIASMYYGNPFYWPNIYKNNTDKIYDADLRISRREELTKISIDFQTLADYCRFPSFARLL